jgi:hypothetical protein
MSCTNNLKNLGLALDNFENTRGKLPPGQVMGPLPEAGVFNAVNHGWGPFILPFIEEQPLFDRYRWDLKGTDPVNRPFGATHLTIFQCPTAPEPNRYYTAGPSGMGACGNYAPTWYVDSILVEEGLIDPPANYYGVLQPNYMTRWSARSPTARPKPSCSPKMPGGRGSGVWGGQARIRWSKEVPGRS